MSEWFENNAPIASVPIGDRGLHYGDGLFETIAVRQGKIRLWQRHVERLESGCRALAFSIPDEGKLFSNIHDAISQTIVDNARCVVKVHLTAPDSGRGYGRDGDVQPAIRIGVFDSQPIAATHYVSGVVATMCKTRLATPSATAGLKTLNRLEQVIARRELRSSGSTFEGIMCDAEGHMICGTVSNLFLVSEGEIVTPDLSQCGVAGVMRAHTIEALQRTDIPLKVKAFGVTELDNTQEIFLANSQFGILPVASLDRWRSSSRHVVSLVRERLKMSGVVEEGTQR